MIICGTGHRPNKVGGYSEAATEKLITIAIDWLKEARPDKVITGGALGWDQALGWAAAELGLHHTLALPFAGFWSKWPKESQDLLEHLASLADKVVYVNEEGYAPWKMQVRNEWMVDRCDTVLALWDGSAGGTGNCIQYANKVGKPIVNLWDMYDSGTR
jgi:uncharacterized phage-like protein YoqJ